MALNDDFVLINNLGFEYNNEKQEQDLGNKERHKILNNNFKRDNSIQEHSGYSFDDYKLVQIDNFIDKNYYYMTGIFIFFLIFFLSLC